MTTWVVSKGPAPGSSTGVLGLQTHIYSCPGDGDYAYVGVKRKEAHGAPRLVHTQFMTETESYM